MEAFSCKVLILGGGPGGYVAAIRAGQLGLDTILVERDALGGTCLNVGCIPSKALIHAADEFERVHRLRDISALGISAGSVSIDIARTVSWKDGLVSKLRGGVEGLLRRAKVCVLHGNGVLKDGKTCIVEAGRETCYVEAEHVVIATGSEPLALPQIPFGGPVISSTDALALKELPRRMTVVGGGYIGLELGMAFQKLGTEVVLIEATDRLLPHYDYELTKPVAARAAELGMTIHLKSRVTDFAEKSGAVIVTTAEEKVLSIAAEKVLVTIGRRPRFDGFGLEGLSLDMDGNAIKINDECRTSMRNVWAIGDITGEPMLAHRAMAQGEMVAEIIAGHKRSFDKVAIPAICFTDPEIVVTGLSPDSARAAGYETLIGVFPFSANGRAMTTEVESGFVRVVARADNHVLLGIQAVGKGISELAAGFSLALEMGARLEDIAATVHAHPTQGEALQEASMKALGQALHI